MNAYSGTYESPVIATGPIFLEGDKQCHFRWQRNEFEFDMPFD